MIPNTAGRKANWIRGPQTSVVLPIFEPQQLSEFDGYIELANCGFLIVYFIHFLVVCELSWQPIHSQHLPAHL